MRVVMVADVVVAIVMSAGVIIVPGRVANIVVATTRVIVPVVVQEAIIMGRLKRVGDVCLFSDREFVTEVIYIEVINGHGKSFFLSFVSPKSITDAELFQHRVPN